MAAVSRNMQSSVPSSSPNGPSSTATVFEFMCLYTHDLRRKQKRWQDGRLKFHAFNKRIMVHDERGNYIGDTHWREDYDFGEGEEVTLERGGIMVQAAECVGTRSQDLSELIDKRVQEKAQRQSAAIARHAGLSAQGNSPSVPRAAASTFQTRHTHLNNLLGTPSGHHGRALVPKESPFEGRQRSNPLQSHGQSEESPQPAKRRKRDISPPSKTGYAQNLFGATLTLSGRPMSSAPVRHRLNPSQLQPRDRELPSSSGISNQNEGDRDVLEIAQPVDTMSSKKTGPLSDKGSTAVNVSRTQSDVLIGRDARSKANVPSLLLQRNATNRREAGPPNESPETSSIKPDVASHRRKDSQLPLQRTSVGDKCRRKSDPLHSVVTRASPTASSHQPSEKPLKKSKRNQHKPIPEDLGRVNNKNQATARPGSIESSLSDEVMATSVHRTAALSVKPPQPRTELRMKPSKKRGLLVLSEKQDVKKARKPKRSRTDDSLSPVTHQTAHSESSEMTVLEEDISARSAGQVLDSDIMARRDGAKHASRNTEFYSESDVGANEEEPTDSVLACMQVTRSETSKSRKAVVEAWRTNEDSEERHGFPDMPIHGPVQGDAEGPQARSQVEGEIISSTRHTGRHHDGLISDDSSERNKEHQKGAGEMIGHRSERPPPRLAQLSRKGIRSKEVIGLFFDDDDQPALHHRHQKEIVLDHQESRQQQQKQKAIDNREDTGTNVQLAEELTTESSRLGMQRPEFGQVYDSESRKAPVIGRVAHSTHTQPDLPAVASAPRDEACLQTPGTGRYVDTESQPRNKPELLNSAHSFAAQAAQLDTMFPKRHSVSQVKFKSTAKFTSTRENDSIQADPRESQGIGTDSGTPEVQTPTGSVRQTEPTLEKSGLRRTASLPVAKDSSESISNGSTFDSANRNSTSGRDTESGSKPRAQSNVSLLNSEQLHHSHMQNDVHEDVVGKQNTSQWPVPRLANPATRGKKAAKPSDAAGQLLESIIPVDAGVGAARQPNRSSVCPTDKAAKQSTTSLPGFSRANGGPWSREAFDLFEYKRPR
ncbi:hypothetical protein JX265_008224 [Neoarthrinium moseri]|uniref:5'-3' DNA helicase ZGRF1-like N-terminal domain-containing protein n=1 Tax=Neoarthrinium moseri TaxID=1658444 RepID=A0A9Q0AMF8_9PEZI|nr:hypothetical protein JX265_008224 [Neoarthrinium moseri]